jgi:hypothetical protein
MLPMAPRRRLLLLVWLFLLSGPISADSSENKEATLVEVHSAPRCYGLDCPPWPMPANLDFCFQAGDAYYVAVSHLWVFHWTNKAKRLLELQGQSVEIMVSDRDIRVVDPHFKVRLRVVHNDSGFKLDACNHT